MIRKISVAVLPLVLLLSLNNVKAGDKDLKNEAAKAAPGKLADAAKTGKSSSQPTSRTGSPVFVSRPSESPEGSPTNKPASLTDTIRPTDINPALQAAAPAAVAAVAAINLSKTPQTQEPLSAPRPPALTTSDSPASKPAPVSASSSSAFSSSSSAAASSAGNENRGPINVNTNVSPTANMISVETAYTSGNIVQGLANQPKESVKTIAALLEALEIATKSRPLSPTSHKLLAAQQNTIGDILNPRQQSSGPQQASTESKSSLSSQSSSSSSASTRQDGKGLWGAFTGWSSYAANSAHRRLSSMSGTAKGSQKSGKPLVPNKSQDQQTHE